MTGKALIDNWMIQFACDLLEIAWPGSGRRKPKRQFSGYEEYISEDHPPPGVSKELRFVQSIPSDFKIALLHFIDVCVLFDEIQHDPTRSFVWKGSQAADRIAPLLKPIAEIDSYRTELVEANDAEKGIMTANGSPGRFSNPPFNILGAYVTRYAFPHFDPFLETEEQEIERGAMFYSCLAQCIDAVYWPSPKRKLFLEKNYFERTASPAVMVFKGIYDTQLKKIAEELLAQLPGVPDFLSLPSFGHSVLQRAGNGADILDIILELRGAVDTAALREWFTSLDACLKIGDLVGAARGIRELSAIVTELRRQVGLIEGEKTNPIEFQIGLTPSVTFTSSWFKRIIQDKAIAGPRHITVLRRYANSYLEAANLDYHFNRLFLSTEDG